MRLGELIDGLPLRPLHPTPTAPTTPTSPPAPASPLDIRICDLTEDSRTVLPGSLFIARPGAKADGRAFAAAAVRAGAVAILADHPDLALPAPARGQPAPVLLVADDVPLTAALLAERFYGDPSSQLDVIGVTGTNGKTTVTFLVRHILNHALWRCGLIGTVVIDDGTEIAPAQLTTPPALELSRSLARMLESGCKAAAIETSSHALHQQRTAGLTFSVGIFTNLTRDHLDYHHTMERYADAKALLFERLPPHAAAIVNAADPAAPRMVRGCRAKVLGCVVTGPHDTEHALPQPGLKADARATIRHVGPAGMRVTFEGPWQLDGDPEPWDIDLPLVGAHNAMNALQAALAAWSLGVADHAIADALRHAPAPPGRLEPVTAPHAPFAVYVDYAHTDDALRRVLLLLRRLLEPGFADGADPVPPHARGQLHVVFGCGGDRDRSKRPLMGAAAAALADHVIITSDNPRTEDPATIIDHILAGVAQGQRHRVSTIPDRLAAIHAAINHAQPGDIVLLAGKGHEDYQLIPDGHGGTLKRHFDDRLHARHALAQRTIPTRPPALEPPPRPHHP